MIAGHPGLAVHPGLSPSTANRDPKVSSVPCEIEIYSLQVDENLEKRNNVE